MKKIITITVLALATSFMSCDKENQAPQKVKDAFAKKFPTAKDVEWDKESETEWEAEFKLNNKEYSSNFMQDGTWMETEYEVSKSEIPQLVMSALNSNFEGYDIEEMEMAETKNGKVYEFIIEKGETEMEVAIDLTGKIVKKELKKEEKDND